MVSKINPDPEITNGWEIQFVRNGFMKYPFTTALAVAYGFGGYNCALLLGKYYP
jgi:3-oxoacyl-(acyl-carrier-protein) synthase